MRQPTKPLATIHAITPPRAVAGGRVTLRGSGFPVEETRVLLGDAPARLAFTSTTRLVISIPGDLDGGSTPVRLADGSGETMFLSIAAPCATGLHQVDNPAFDSAGNLFVAYSGSRGQEAPVSIFRVTRAGTREPFASGIVNATSMAYGPDGQLYVSSRFEGAVYVVREDGTREQVASDLGVACGIAFDSDGWMYVGDRSGTVFRVRDGRAHAFATLPASVAAFHLAMSAQNELFVSAPTLGAYDHVYRIGRQGDVRTLPAPLGRPQGLAFSPDGVLHVIDALAGASGLYRFDDLEGTPELVVSGGALVGVAFGPSGELVVASNETAYLFEHY
ncbi:MAG TPA: IPT/TIG domain-containing protein [Hyalangium sp.]|nr:IPT/TIG domain-containing protein [Hyalangium sp.]